MLPACNSFVCASTFRSGKGKFCASAVFLELRDDVVLSWVRLSAHRSPPAAFTCPTHAQLRHLDCPDSTIFITFQAQRRWSAEKMNIGQDQGGVIDPRHDSARWGLQLQDV